MDEKTLSEIENHYYFWATDETNPKAIRLINQDIPALTAALRRAWAEIVGCYQAIDEMVGQIAAVEEAINLPTPILDLVSKRRLAAKFKELGIDEATAQPQEGQEHE